MHFRIFDLRVITFKERPCPVGRNSAEVIRSVSLSMRVDNFGMKAEIQIKDPNGARCMKRKLSCKS
jgi:hypothetical protein